MWEDIRTFAKTSNQHPLIMSMCGISYCDGSYLIHRNCSPIWVMEYVIEGTGTVMLDGNTYTASAGDVYLLPAKHAHHYYSDNKNPWTKIFFNVSGIMMNSLAENYGLTGQVVFKDCPVEPLFRELLALTKQKLTSEELLSQCTLQIHKIFMAVHKHKIKKNNIPSDALQLKEYIDSKITGQLTMQELSKIIYRSDDYIINLFKNTFNQTPYAYFLEHKMEMAITLLAGTTLTVGQVSEYLGFADPHYFTNRFRQFTGLSPTAYRKQSLN